MKALAMSIFRYGYLTPVTYDSVRRCDESMADYAPQRVVSKIIMLFLKYLSISHPGLEREAEGNGQDCGSGKPLRILDGIALR